MRCHPALSQFLTYCGDCANLQSEIFPTVETIAVLRATSVPYSTCGIASVDCEVAFFLECSWAFLQYLPANMRQADFWLLAVPILCDFNMQASQGSAWLARVLPRAAPYPRLIVWRIFFTRSVSKRSWPVTISTWPAMPSLTWPWYSPRPRISLLSWILTR